MTQTFPGPVTVAMLTPAYVRTIAYVGGAQGKSGVATANVAYTSNSPAPETGAYTPKTLAEDLTSHPVGDPDFVAVVDICRPEGYLAPNQPYAAAPGAGANPTITSLAPNTAVAGSPSPLTVIVTGTNFTQWTTLNTGGVSSPYIQYNSPTKLTILMDPARSVPGVVSVTVTDHGVTSAGSNFTYT